MARERVLIILNPVAGHKAAQKALFPLVKRLCAQDSTVIVHTTRAHGEAAQVARETGAGCDRIIVLGGDGTLSEVLGGLVRAGAKVPVGYVPTGTTNDLAHALHLPAKAKDAIEVASGGCVRQHDAGLLGEAAFFDYVASFGAFADTAFATPQSLKNKLGRMAYIFRGAREVFALRPHPVTVTAGGRVVSGAFYYGSISNSTRIGGVVDLSGAGVRFDDGLMEILLIRQPPTVQAMRDFAHQVYDPDYFVFLQADEATFRFEAPAEWTVDGECAGEFTEVTFRCLPRAVQLIAPKQA